jgi:hypothetical protein
VARRVDGRRWFVRILIVGLVSASGCSGTRPWSRGAVGDTPGPIRDLDTRPEVGPFSRLHEWVVKQKNGLIDPNQMP